jgi:hypothetical protein
VCWPASSIQQFEKRAVELARTTTVFISDCVILQWRTVARESSQTAIAGYLVSEIAK